LAILYGVFKLQSVNFRQFATLQALFNQSGSEYKPADSIHIHTNCTWQPTTPLQTTGRMRRARWLVARDWLAHVSRALYIAYTASHLTKLILSLCNAWA